MSTTTPDSDQPAVNSPIVAGSVPDAANIAPGAEFSSAAPSDYIGGSKGGIVSLGDNVTESRHEVKTTLDFIQITNTSTRGEVLIEQLFDSYMDSGSSALSELFELYVIEFITIALFATSPFGTSSGAAQFAPHWDIVNSAYNSSPSEDNIAKAIRQEDSFISRPRESHMYKYVTNGEPKFTTFQGSLRWSVYGALVAVCRDVAGLGDQTRIAVTLTASIKFMRNSFFSGQSRTGLFEHLNVEVNEDGLYLSRRDTFVSTMVDFRLTEPLVLNIKHNTRDQAVLQPHNTRIVSHSIRAYPDEKTQRYVVAFYPENFGLPMNQRITSVKIISRPHTAKLSYVERTQRGSILAMRR